MVEPTPRVRRFIDGSPLLQVMSHMKFPVHCSACRCVNQFEWKHVGQRAACDGCGTLLTVPAPMETIDEPAPPPPLRAVKFRCPSCRRKFATKPDMVGQKIRCSGCGAGVRVPWAVEVDGGTPSSQMAVATFAGTDEVKTVLAPRPRRSVSIRFVPIFRGSTSAAPLRAKSAP